MSDRAKHLLNSANVGEAQGSPQKPTNGDASIAIIGDPTAGTIRIAVHNAKTEMLEAGRYIDALEEPSATSSRRCGSGKSWSRPIRGARCCRHARGPPART